MNMFLFYQAFKKLVEYEDVFEFLLPPVAAVSKFHFQLLIICSAEESFPGLGFTEGVEFESTKFQGRNFIPQKSWRNEMFLGFQTVFIDF